MKTIWDRIHVWLKANAPEVLASLRPGATEEAIRAAEGQMGVTLPDDVRAAYRIHDGQELGKYGCAKAFLYGWDWCSLKCMLSQWNTLKGLRDDGTFDEVRSDPSSAVRNDWWHPKWIPVADSGMGYLYCIDLAPKKRGRHGQVILWCHDDGNRPVRAPDFARWLDRFEAELRSGQWVTSEEHGGLLNVRDL